MYAANCGQRQTVISQFYQLDKLVVEGPEAVSLPTACSRQTADVLQRDENPDNPAVEEQKVKSVRFLARMPLPL